VSKAIGDLGLDTNGVIVYLQGHPLAVSWVEAADALLLPVICFGELRYGALHSQKPTENLAKLEAFVDLCSLLDVTRNVGERYAEIRQALAEKGTPIPEADLWIAAICREHELAVLSEDAHFDRVPGLTRYDWTQPQAP
jgi:tRNA(fMet)-specific endonuclease VapC